VHNQANEAEPSWPGTDLVVPQCSYGVGKWRLIQKDDVCGPVLANRSNVDLKVRWEAHKSALP